jgi:hypothetical protein
MHVHQRILMFMFPCTWQAVGTTLQIRNWSELWTQTHLQQRLLEPLGGLSLSLTDGGTIAVLQFESERTAQRAELICRAAAKTAEENLKRPSRTVSPPLTRQPSSCKPPVRLHMMHMNTCCCRCKTRICFNRGILEKSPLR